MRARVALSALAMPTALAGGAVLAVTAAWLLEGGAVFAKRPAGTVAGDPAPDRSPGTAPPVEPVEPEEDAGPATYVGAAACKKCHIRQFRSWSKTRMASSFDALKPCDLETYEGKHLAERRRTAGLDPAADFRSEARCLKCHTTGYGLPGGYPETVTAENREHAERLRGVQCESCHGPGSRYVRFFERLRPDDRYRRSEVLALGLVLPDRNVCLGCHNDGSPFVPKEEFDFEKMKEEGTHDHTRALQLVGEEGE